MTHLFLATALLAGVANDDGQTAARREDVASQALRAKSITEKLSIVQERQRKLGRPVLREQQVIAERLAFEIDKLLRLLMEDCPDTPIGRFLRVGPRP